MRPVPSLVVAVLVVTTSCAKTSAPAVFPAPTAGASASAPATPPPPTGMKPWAEVVKDTRAVEGLFKLHFKRDATLLLELTPEQLDAPFGMAMHLSRGTGVFNIHDGLPLSDGEMMRFRRVGDRVYLVHVNPRFTAAAGSPMRLSMDENVGHSVVAGFKVEAEDPKTKAVLVDVTSWLVSDYGNMSEQLKAYWGGKPVMFDRERSFVGNVMGFPENVEIDTELTYRPSDTPSGPAAWEWAGVSDMRSIPVGVRYSLFALPKEPMRPRAADPRVGYFATTVRDFSRDRQPDPFVRYVNRWRLEADSCDGGLCTPKKPIVFYIDRTVPREYRQAVREGIEGWNRGFEAAGWRNAIQAREAPDDSTWSAEDMRYSTVRWTAAHSMGYAIGPSQVDPRTGEILNADILISSSFPNWWNESYDQLVGPTGMLTRSEQHDHLHAHLPPHLAARLCMAEMGKAHDLRLTHTALAALGTIDGTQPMPDEFVNNAIRDLVMHEVGHTLGLRHNFRGSSAIPYDRLNDRAFTREHGLTLSVMDYAGTNIALDPAQQGDHVNHVVGSYDVWAIRYGYTASPVAQGSSIDDDAERSMLRRIAAESTHPMHAYNTDEDTHLGAMAVDPRSNVWDLGSDPLRFARDRALLVDRVQPRIEDRMIAHGEGYARLRGAVSTLIFERARSLLPATKVVGGIDFSRAHRGDPGAPDPFTPVPAARQREAVRLIVDQAFAPGAFRFEADLLNRLPPARNGDWSGPWMVAPIDFPVHQAVGSVQAQLLRELTHNARLQRMIDNTVRMPAGSEAYTVAEMFSSLTGAIWTEVGARPRSIDSFRRNLQMAHLDEMTRMLVRPMPTPPPPPNAFASVAPMPVPGEARALARLELVELRDRIGASLASPRIDRETRAHLTEARSRIQKSLDATLTEPAR